MKYQAQVRAIAITTIEQVGAMAFLPLNPEQQEWENVQAPTRNKANAVLNAKWEIHKLAKTGIIAEGRLVDVKTGEVITS